jgi:hypothetical protein
MENGVVTEHSFGRKNLSPSSFKSTYSYVFLAVTISRQTTCEVVFKTQARPLMRWQI